MKQSVLIKFLVLSYKLCFVIASWNSWWTYDGISGPEFWELNPKWTHCSKGRKQSPVDINTNRLLFDPGLKAIQLNGDLVEGNLENTGRGLHFNLRSNYTRKFWVFGGPLAYEYRLSHLILHFGRENDRGSEHTLNGIKFPDAESQPNGLAVISILIQLIDSQDDSNGKRNIISNEELSKLLETMDQIKYKGTAQVSHQLNVNSLLPRTQFYLTYEGSLSEPPCTETVNWIILNKPIYILERNLFNLRNSIVIDGYGDNFRPIQALNNRCITTNIANNLNTNANSVDNNEEKQIKKEPKLNEDLGRLANSSNQDKDELSGLKRFCTTGNVYGFYSYKSYEIYFNPYSKHKTGQQFDLNLNEIGQFELNLMIHPLENLELPKIK